MKKTARASELGEFPKGRTIINEGMNDCCILYFNFFLCLFKNFQISTTFYILPQKGELVWVKCGKTEHPAFRVESEPPRLNDDGELCHYIQWQLQGDREFVPANLIKSDIGCRRNRPSQPVCPQTRSLNPNPKHNEVTARKATKQRIKEETVNTANIPPSMITVKRKVTARKTIKQRIKKDTADTTDAPPSLVTSCTPFAWAEPLVQRAKEPKVLEDRLPAKDDTVQIGDNLYVVTGFSEFNNRFQQFPDLVEVKHELEGDRRRRYACTESCLLDPQEGQVQEGQNGEMSDIGSTRIEPPVAKDKGAKATSKIAARMDKPAVNGKTVKGKKAELATDSKGKKTTATSNNKRGTSVYSTSECLDCVCPPGTVYANAGRRIQRAKRARKLCDRPVDDGDVLYHRGNPYIVEGYSCFYNRFEHFPDLLQLQSASSRDCVYVPWKIVELDRQKDQTIKSSES